VCVYIYIHIHTISGLYCKRWFLRSWQ